MNEYQRRYTAWSERWWLNDPLGLFTNWRVEDRFGPKFNAALENKHREIYPRRKKIKLTQLPDAVIAPIKEHWVKIGIAWLTREMHYRRCLDAWLTANADNVVIKTGPDTILKESNTGTYSSQGSGRYTYAKNALLLEFQTLEKHNIPVRIEEEKTSWGAYYRLIAPIEKYMLDALMRRDTTSVHEWAVDMWRKGSNPKVYNPFLSDAIYEVSMREAMNV